MSLHNTALKRKKGTTANSKLDMNEIKKYVFDINLFMLNNKTPFYTETLIIFYLVILEKNLDVFF